MSVIRCAECGEPLIIKRERIAMWTQTDFYEVTGNLSEPKFRQCDSEMEQGSLEEETFSCELCDSDLPDLLIDALIEQEE